MNEKIALAKWWSRNASPKAPAPIPMAEHGTVHWQRSVASMGSTQVPATDYGRMLIISEKPTTPRTQPADVLMHMRMTHASQVLNTVVEIDPDKAGGAPVMSGTRIKVAQVLAEMADGRSVAYVSREYGVKRDMITSLLHGMATGLDKSFVK